MKIFLRIWSFPIWLIKEIIINLPIEFSRVRVIYYKLSGNSFHSKISLGPNVRFRGKVSIGEGTSIAQNVTISGMSSGVMIGQNVMIAPNVVIVAFNHGYSDTKIPMNRQPNTEATVVIKDDVWIGANVTIGKGVTVGSGSIIASNSFVNKDVEDFSIVGGVPAGKIGSR